MIKLLVLLGLPLGGYIFFASKEGTEDTAWAGAMVGAVVALFVLFVISDARSNKSMGRKWYR